VAANGLPQHVFLDTQVYERVGFQYDSKPFRALSELITKERLKLLATDIVVGEVEKHIDVRVRQAFNAHKEFADGKGRILKGSGVPGVADRVQWFERDAVIADLTKQFHDFLDKHKAETVDVDDVSIDELLADYFGKKPPFKGDLPKPEFPDAINAKALCEWAEFNEVDVFVVSGDEGFREACAACKQLHVFDQLGKLLDRVADDDKKLADFIRAQAIAHIDEIKAEAVKEYEGLWFYLKDEDGEAQVTVDEARFEGDVEVLELGDGEATVVVSFLLEYTAEASFGDPDMQSYDSETGETFSWGTKEETVHRRGRARVELSVWFEGLDPGSVQIKNVRLVEPSESVGIDVYDPRDFK
jgi:hypothetical protein